LKILHILRNKGDHYAVHMALQQAKEGGHDVAILLLHDAVFEAPLEGVKTFASRKDVLARGITSHAELVDYPQIVDLIFKYDSSICW